MPHLSPQTLTQAEQRAIGAGEVWLPGNSLQEGVDLREQGGFRFHQSPPDSIVDLLDLVGAPLTG